MKISIDEESCVGCGNCVEICPDVLEMQDNLAVAKITDVPGNLQACCREAADSCPVEAVIIEE
jgi:ferredoxin